MADNDKPENIQNRLNHLEQADRHVEHRLEALDKSVADLRNVNLESHKWLMTTLFAVMAVVVTVVFGGAGVLLIVIQNQAREDLHTELTDMQSKVDRSVDQMNQNFKNLAGEALKKPQLIVANNDGPLDGQTITLDQSRQFKLFPLFITNEGDKRSGSISVRLFSSDDLNLREGGAVQRVDINNKDYPYCYYLSVNEMVGTTVDLAPAETWTFPNILQYSYIPLGTNQFINCKLDIYYDSGPAEAKFRIKSF